MARSRFVILDDNNVDDHHLCCALGDPKHVDGVERKRTWLKKRFREGLVFRKLDERGKAFIEYMPSEMAWRPIVAPGWITVHCLWVSGRLAKQGHARALVEGCIADAKGQEKAGVVIASAKTKRPFLSDPKFLKHLGFEVVDKRGEYRLFAYVLDKNAKPPQFAKSVKPDGGDTGEPFVARHTDQCPFNAHWAPEMANSIENRGREVKVEHVRTRAKAQKVASPLGTFGLEQSSTVVTHHLNTDAAVGRLLSRRGQ
ncbi:MAG: GNAT family N-acetyltransferase [Myxococcota bacterium]